jgi:hypothetical protein
LAETLRRRRFEAMQGDAEFVRNHPVGHERTAEAERLVREAMYEHALGRLAAAERDRILAILSFAADSMRASNLEDLADFQPQHGSDV